MKKNIIIIGPGRVGKTTLAKKLNEKLCYSVIGTDDLCIAFEEGMPEAKIGTPNSHETSVANIAPFLATYVSALAWRSKFYNGTKYVFEDGKGYFDFDKLIPIWEVNEPDKDYWKTQYLIIGLVYHNQTPNNLFDAIREHDTGDDWTHMLSDDELWSHIIGGIEYSRTIFDKLQGYDHIIYDVSHNRDQVLDKVVEDVIAMFA